MSRRVAVVGVGILGACVGWELTRLGADVVLIDAGRPGEGVTNWSFSWVNASNKTARRSYFELNVAGMAAYRELAGIVGPDSWWHPSGHLRWADDPVVHAGLLETARLLDDWDYRVELLSGAEVRRRLEPALAIADDAPVLFYPDEAWVHGRPLVSLLVGQAVALGAERYLGTAVRDISTASDGSVRAIVLSDGTRLGVDAVVNAAGPDAAHIAALVARNLPMRREPGVVTRLTCAQVPIRRAMHTPHVEIRPDGDGSVVLHSREVDAQIDASDGLPQPAQRLHDSARLARWLCDLAGIVVPELGGAGVAGTRISERPVPADGYPSVGAVPGVSGYYEAVTHSGITLGPVIGRLLASEIVGGADSELLADFRPGRLC